jgi:hypothetical protein
MAAGRRGVVPAGAHGGEVAAGEADITKQMVVELHQVGEDPLSVGATEHGRQAESHLIISSVWVAPGTAERAYARKSMNA